MDMQEAREKLKQIDELRFYKKYIDQSLAGDFSQDIWLYIEKLQAENEELKRTKQDINKIKADAIREVWSHIGFVRSHDETSEFSCGFNDACNQVDEYLLEYANKLGDKQ